MPWMLVILRLLGSETALLLKGGYALGGIGKCLKSPLKTFQTTSNRQFFAEDLATKVEPSSVGNGIGVITSSMHSTVRHNCPS
ncbi:hypothetical protein NIES4103_66430 [Nostoc sp. NIES-4103]|nr:hypothetical protein NIES4103_66430 [Nostoc sp. NIES-4103]